MKASTARTLFSRTTTVSADIEATADVVWGHLVDGAAWPSWTSTVVSFTGQIAPGAAIALRSSLDPSRTFKLKVRVFAPPQTLVWGDGMGERSYELQRTGERRVTLTMREKIGGPLFPLFARMIPSFDDAFDTFVADLKRRAEGAQP